MCICVMDSTQNNPTFKDTSLPPQKSQENGSDDTEISIFDAHKYFNDTKPEQTPSHNLLHFRTPTASSEASWNSRTGLLPYPPVSADRRSKWISSAKKWLRRTKCCCNGQNSVQVEEVKSDSEHKQPVVLISTKKTSQNLSNNTDHIVEIHHIKAMDLSAIDAPRHQRISASGRSFIDGAVGFTFPILNPSSDRVKPIGDGLFQGFRPTNEIPSMENPNMTARDDDVGSEASSDLFEIESFSTQTASYPTYRRRDSADDQDQTCSATRFASANEVGDIQHGRRTGDEPPAAEDELCCPSGDVNALRPRREDAGDCEGKRKSGLTIISCGQEKAVGVGSPAVEMPPMFALHVGAWPPQANTPPLGSSYSGRLSPAFAA